RRAAREGRPACAERTTPSCEHLLERRAGEIVLRDEAAHAAGLDPRPVRAPLAVRDEHDLQLRVREQHAPRDLEPVEVGELDVQQDELRGEALGEGERRGPVDRLAHDVEPLLREERGGAAQEAGMIVDDQDAPRRLQLSEQLPVLHPHHRPLWSAHTSASPTPARSRAPAEASPSPAPPLRGSQSSQRGRYQFQSPSSFISAGSSTARTTVESIRIAAASPKPICLMSSVRSVTKIANTATITTAALVTGPAVRLIPVATASSVRIPESTSSLMRLRMNT